MRHQSVLGLVWHIGVARQENLEAVPISEVEINASGTINLSYGISANCENPQKAVDFLELLYTDEEVANIFNNGIEGKHYVKQEGSKIIKYPEGVDSMSAGYGSFIGPIGNASILYFREPFTDQFVENIDKYGLKRSESIRVYGICF